MAASAQVVQQPSCCICTFFCFSYSGLRTSAGCMGPSGCVCGGVLRAVLLPTLSSTCHANRPQMSQVVYQRTVCAGAYRLEGGGHLRSVWPSALQLWPHLVPPSPCFHQQDPPNDHLADDIYQTGGGCSSVRAHARHGPPHLDSLPKFPPCTGTPHIHTLFALQT